MRGIFLPRFTAMFHGVSHNLKTSKKSIVRDQENSVNFMHCLDFDSIYIGGL